ncbi:MAG: hypothetical protein WCG86_03530 [Actinomycetota bacterium]|jgi:dienelactone hydrolase
MTDFINTGAPLEVATYSVGRSTHLLVDDQRRNRYIGVDCWYPAVEGSSTTLSNYELLPGIGFTSHALDGATPLPGPHPVIIWSHGSSGTRHVYSQLCEALAGRGYVIVACDHPGNTMPDYVLNLAVDEETNQRQRIEDLQFLVDSVAGLRPGFDHGLTLDYDQIVVGGHSFGANSSVSFAATQSSGPVMRGVAGLEPYLRTVPAEHFSALAVPLLLIGADHDTTTPPPIDMAFATKHLDEDLLTALCLENVGHQGCSDVGMYLEVAPRIAGVPEMVTDYIATMSEGVTGTAGDPWRPVVLQHVEILGAWLNELFGVDRGTPTLSDATSRASVSIFA